ncbi:cytochrome P450 4c3-like [Belonocnema kinseyi]|uniref:cytochrome P450 4c3-like n=1 Tax=Belonocnema kinseyi TaxID=2817044 RepID=UPI00143D5E6A|nr:cytochrome P450 4c3-like [Belonocnema kinseyi]
MTAIMQPTLKAGGQSWNTTLVLSLCVAGMFLALFVKRAKFLYSLRKVPSPFALPVIGNALQLNCDLEVFFKKLVQWSCEFGDLFIIWVGMRPFLWIYRVEQVQPLLSSSIHIDKSPEYEFVRPWLGTGLLTSNGVKWHARRKLLSPTFHNELLKEYLKVAIKEVNVLTYCLQDEVGKAAFDIVPYTKRAALDVICNTAMGYPINAQTNRKNEYVLAVERLQTLMQMRFTNIWIKLDPIFNMTSWGKEQARLINIIHSFVDKVIFERKIEWSLKVDGNFNEKPRRTQALLDLLLDMNHNGAKLSDEDLREEVNTFMFAGHDTIATSVSWLLYALGRKPEYQKLIIEEYENVVGSAELTIDLLSKLVWLDVCLKESWRLYPVAPLIARQINSPFKLSEQVIPAGTTVLVHSYLLHRDPRYFPQPEVYMPERFLPDKPKPPPFTYIPFSAGSRNCIGWKFAQMEVKVTMLAILRAYEIQSIQTEDQLRFISNLVLDNAGGIPIRIKPRKAC